MDSTGTGCGPNISGSPRCWRRIIAYNCFDDAQKSPILVDAEVGRTILSLSVGAYPKEVLSVFPSESVHLGRTFKQISACGQVPGVELLTVHP